MQYGQGDPVANETERSKGSTREGCFTKVNAIVSVIGVVIAALSVALPWHESERPLPSPPVNNPSPSPSPPLPPPVTSIEPVVPDSVRSPPDRVAQPTREPTPPSSQSLDRTKDVTFVNSSNHRFILYVRYGSEDSCRSKPQSSELRVDPGQTASIDSGGSNACFCLKKPERRTCLGGWIDAKTGSTQRLQ